MSTNQISNAADEQFLTDLLQGLNQQPKTLPCKYFYDRRGSQLFDQICELDEYYITRTEQAIMDEHAQEMAQQLGEGVGLIELGSGSSTKTRILLEHLIDPAAYIPVDISRKHLLATAEELRSNFPHIEILPVVADFTQPFNIPTSKTKPSHHAVYFPGSTIGNFQPESASQLISKLAQQLGPQGGMLIGADLQKDASVLEAAYNDSEGVTAEFNLNLLARANEQLEANFNIDQFSHRAVYNSEAGRVEMYLISEVEQTVEFGEQSVTFEAGERILTEYSHKYTIESFEALMSDAGFELHRVWKDDREYFGVFHFVLAD